MILPWKYGCVDLIKPNTLKGKDGTVMDFMHLTMIDTESVWFEIIKLPNASVICMQKWGKTSEVVIDKSYSQVSILFNSFSSTIAYMQRWPMACRGTQKFSSQRGCNPSPPDPYTF